MCGGGLSARRGALHQHLQAVRLQPIVRKRGGRKGGSACVWALSARSANTCRPCVFSLYSGEGFKENSSISVRHFQVSDVASARCAGRTPRAAPPTPQAVRLQPAVQGWDRKTTSFSIERKRWWSETRRSRTDTCRPCVFSLQSKKGSESEMHGAEGGACETH